MSNYFNGPMSENQLAIAVSLAERDLKALDEGQWVPDADDVLWVAAALVQLAKGKAST